MISAIKSAATCSADRLARKKPSETTTTPIGGAQSRVLMSKPKQSVSNKSSMKVGAASQGERSVDLQLVERVKRGDKKAFDVLVLKYQNRMLTIISRYVYDHSDALDVAQEAFIKAYRALPKFRGDSAFYTWLYRIAINTAKNHLVSQNRRPPAVDVEPLDAEQLEGNSDLKDFATPEEHLHNEEVERIIIEAMEALPDDLRTALTLRELEGLTYEEIAKEMDCPVGTVRSRIFRAREAINSCLDGMLSA